MSLWTDFLVHSRDRTALKWKHYFPAYERHFSRFVNRDVTFLEIGCGEGGSSHMWMRYLGPHARIVSLDIRPECKAFEQDQISIRIGSQSDHAFLQSVADEFGIPDVVLDDGSHIMSDVNATFDFLYPLLKPNSVYMVEDMHTAYMEQFGGGLRKPGTFIERCKGLIDELNGELTFGAGLDTPFTRSTHSMHFYDSIVVFEKGRHTSKHMIETK